MSFETDIECRSVQKSDDGAIFEGEMNRDWFIIVGPNGGFIAALLARAMTRIINDPLRPLRTLTIDFFSVPQIGAFQIDAKIIRQGRNLTFIKAEIFQNDKLNARAIASFACSYAQGDGGGDSDGDDKMLKLPALPPPSHLPLEQCEKLETPLPIHENYDMRPAFGTLPFMEGKKAVSGGWTRLKEPPASFSAEILAAISDCWPPALFSIMSLEQFEASRGLPTIELSVYFTAPANLSRYQNKRICSRSF